MDQLRMQIRLLVAYNGRQRVLEELASIGDVDLATVERELDKMCPAPRPKAPAKSKRPRRRRSAHDLIRDSALSDDIRPLVEQLAIAYEERSFLPELWRVRRFLGSQGVPADKVRSRADALPKVFSVLSTLSSEELNRFVLELNDSRSDLSVLADQIMGPSDRSRSNTEEKKSRPVVGSVAPAAAV